jgi:hypothetical protein
MEFYLAVVYSVAICVVFLYAFKKVIWPAQREIDSDFNEKVD